MVLLILIILGVISVLFVFSDVALLSDISKQYEAGFAQPEWTLVFPIMGFQFIFALVLTYLQVSGYFLQTKSQPVVRDSNIFLVVQVVGVVCGLMGLGLSSLGFFFRGGWSLLLHTIISGLVLIFPYGLAVLYWLMIKLREKNRVWWDEKQSQDVGRSAMVTLALDTVLLLCLFSLNIQDLSGVVRLLWLPLYLFGTMTFFSVGNLFFSSRA
jgi:protein-S-isoprenylcysteine O-methyltransferase Ste14